MPTLRIHNRTSATLNLALSHICPIHFKNSLKPAETWSLEVGSVWFTFESRLDTNTNRYSIIQSAQTIGLVSLTGASLALVVIPLTLTGLAPLLGPTTLAAQVATHNLVAVGSSAEVLQVTTWVAAALANKTIHQLATNSELNEEELSTTLKTSRTMIDSVKYFALSNSLVKGSKNIASGHRDLSKKIPNNKGNALLGIVGGGILNYGTKWLGQKTTETPPVDQGAAPSTVSTQVRGIYIGFKDEYEFEWRDKLNEAGQLVGFELRDIKLDQIVK
ncbi:hypothetical protein DFH28DRAFT_232990 [Melampsora americana]|nr:hypothetical protein DFH28DRAFT_232990 [Melampsora americana]